MRAKTLTKQSLTMEKQRVLAAHPEQQSLEKRSERISVFCTPTEHTTWSEKAAAKGVSLSTYIRSCVNRTKIRSPRAEDVQKVIRLASIAGRIERHLIIMSRSRNMSPEACRKLAETYKSLRELQAGIADVLKTFRNRG